MPELPIKDQTGRAQRSVPPKESPPAIALIVDRLLDLVPDSTIYTGHVIQSKLKQAEYGDLASQLVMFSRMIESDAHLSSIIQTRRLTVKKAEQQIVPPEGFEEDDRALVAVAYVDQLISQIIGFQDLIPTLIDGPVRGFAANEIIWDGPIPIAVVDVPDYVWRWYSGKGLQIKLKSGNWIDVPADKFIIHSPRGHSSVLTRRGNMRSIVKWWLIKNITTRDWASFCELFGIPYRKLTYPSTFSSSDPVVTQVIEALSTMGASGIAALRKDFELELMSSAETGGRGYTPHEGLVRWCDAQMSKSILGQTLTVDTAQATGTYAAATVHNEVRLDIAQADAEAIGETIKRDLFTPAVGYGLGWDYPVPELLLTIEDPVDEKSRAEVLKTAAVDLELPIALSTIYEELRIRKPEEGEDLLEISRDVALPAASPFGDSAAAGDQQNAADAILAATAQHQKRLEILGREDLLGEVPLALEALALLSDREWRELESETISESIARMINANPELGRDPKELLRRLETYYVTHEPEELADVLERTMNSSIVNAARELDIEDEDADELDLEEAEPNG